MIAAFETGSLNWWSSNVVFERWRNANAGVKLGRIVNMVVELCALAGAANLDRANCGFVRRVRRLLYLADLYLVK